MSDVTTRKSDLPVKAPDPCRTRPFLSRARFDFPRVDPPRNPGAGRLIRGRSDGFRLPEMLPDSAFGGGIDDIAAVPPPHLYVVFVIQEMSHVVVSGGGVAQAAIFWQGSNGDADLQQDGPYYYPLPGPGETWAIPSDHGTAIYQALTLDACGLSVSFPVGMESWVVELGDFGLPTEVELGRLTLFDPDTIDRAGLYTFGYNIRAEDGSGGGSDFGLAGVVSVRCTASINI